MSLSQSEIVKDLKAIVKNPHFYKHSRNSSTLIKLLFPEKSHSKSHNLKLLSTDQDIDQKFLIAQNHSRISLNKKFDSQSSSFLSVSREKRDQSQKINYSDAPPPTQYTPDYNSVKPRLINTAKMRIRCLHTKQRKISLPDCVDEYNLECKYPNRMSISGSKMISMDEYTHMITENQVTKPFLELNKSHCLCINFKKQGERKGLPLNQMHESRFELNSNIVNHGKSSKAPNFDKYTCRSELFSGHYKPILKKKYIENRSSLKSLPKPSFKNI